MATFFVQFTHGSMVASERQMEAENLALCQRDVEKILLANEADSATIYEPVVTLKASRSVAATSLRQKT